MLEGKHLYVDSRGIVRKAEFYRGFAIKDEAYMPNGKLVFVNPETNFLEEGEWPESSLEERANLIKNGNPWKKTSDFVSNSNRVIFHPELEEFAEVELNWNRSGYDKVKNLPIEVLI